MSPGVQGGGLALATWPANLVTAGVGSVAKDLPAGEYIVVVAHPNKAWTGPYVVWCLG